MLIAFFLIYQLLQIVLIPVIIAYFCVRFFKKKAFGTLIERFGFVPRPPNTNPVLWIHAVSVGEVLAVEHFINHYKKAHPTHTAYLTTGTVGGMHFAKKLNADYVSFMPFDFLFAMYFAFKRIKPAKLIIVEAEIWPNLLMLAHFKKVPLYLLNARINPKTAHKRRYIGFLYRLFTHIFAQSAQDAQAFKSLGVSADKVSIFGDIKTFNVVEKKQALLAKNNLIVPARQNFFVVLAGSIHAGEVDTYLNSFLNIKKLKPNIKLILVPRHFTWQQELVSKLTDHKISFKLWSETTPIPESLNDLGATITDTFVSHEVLVVCKLGVLFSLYPFANAFCLGGTFVPAGGHNLLEPAVWANPCLIGPYFHKCSAIAEPLYAIGGLIKTKSAKDLSEHLLKLVQNPQKCITMGKVNEDWVMEQAEQTKQNLMPAVPSGTSLI